MPYFLDFRARMVLLVLGFTASKVVGDTPVEDFTSLLQVVFESVTLSHSNHLVPEISDSSSFKSIST